MMSLKEKKKTCSFHIISEALARSRNSKMSTLTVTLSPLEQITLSASIDPANVKNQMNQKYICKVNVVHPAIFNSVQPAASPTSR